MANSISLATRSLRCRRSLSLFGGQLSSSSSSALLRSRSSLSLSLLSCRSTSCAQVSRTNGEICLRQLSTSTCPPPSRLSGNLSRRCGIPDSARSRSGIGRRLQQVRYIRTSPGLLQEQQEDKKGGGEKKISEKVSAATSKILSSIPIPLSQHENIYTIPNILTFSRLVAAPFVGWAILSGHATLALSLFAYAGVTDLVDGWIARRFNQESVVGTIIDPMADKLLMTIGVVCLSLQNAIPIWLATLIIGRDVGLGLSALYFRWISLPPPKTMTRYWDFSLPSAEVKPTLISKVNTALQLVLVWTAMAVPVVSESLGSLEGLGVGMNEGMIGLQYLVAGTTVWSGLSYVFSKDAVKILSEKDIQQRLGRQRKEKKKTEDGEMR